MIDNQDFVNNAKYKDNYQRKIDLNAFVAISVLLGIVTVSLLLFGITNYQQKEAYKTRLENVYQQSYYDLLAGIDDISTDLNKLTVSNGNAYQQKVLSSLNVKSTIAINDLSQLSSSDYLTIKTAKFINQLGDYCYYLATKLRDTSYTLSSEEKQSISSLVAVSQDISANLKTYRDSLVEGGLLDDENGYASTLDNIENTSIDYPSLIYDGPFSDSRQNATPLGIRGNTISQDDALSLAREYVGETYASLIKYVGEEKSKFDTYNFRSDNGNISVQLTTTGQIVSITLPSESGNGEYTIDQCVDIAEQYARSLGYNNMVACWETDYMGVVYINLVPKINNVLIYPDMLKVKVSTSGDIQGIDALSYIMSHQDRTISSPEISEEDAMLQVGGDMTIDNISLALSPIDNEEILCYEISGTIGEDIYFIYVDATTCEEVNVLKVIDSENGSLLL